MVIVLCLLFTGFAAAGETEEAIEEALGVGQVEDALPEEARTYLGDISEDMSLGDGTRKILLGALENGRGYVKNAAGLGTQILAIVLLSGMLRGFGDSRSLLTVELAAVLAIGMCCMGRISGFFTRASETVDSMTAFSGFLFSTLAAATAATGKVGTSTALYGVTSALCGLMTRAMQMVFLPAISCYMALLIADHAVGDGGLSMVGDMLKQLLTGALKLSVIGFTAYLSITGVVSGSADSAAVKAAKLAISTTVPVVGSMIADASETLLVSAGVIRSSVGILGLLGVLAVSIGPFLETGIGYLGLKCTAAAASALGEKQLSSLISGMAGAVGLIAGLTGACMLLLMIGCVCFIKCTVG